MSLAVDPPLGFFAEPCDGSDTWATEVPHEGTDESRSLLRDDKGIARLLSGMHVLVEGQRRMEATLHALCDGQLSAAATIERLHVEFLARVPPGGSSSRLQPLRRQASPGGSQSWAGAMARGASVGSVEERPEATTREQAPDEARPGSTQAATRGGGHRPSVAFSIAVTGENILRTSSGSAAAVNGPSAPDAAKDVLADGWPSTIPIREQLRVHGGFVEEVLQNSEDDCPAVCNIQSAQCFVSENGTKIDYGPPRKPRKYRCMLEPSSSLRVLVDILSLVILIFDMTITPYIIAWEVPFEGFVRMSTYVTMCFWILDIFLSFRTGYYNYGELEMRPWSVARRYLRTFFLPDLAIVATDVLSVVSGSLPRDSLGTNPTEGMKILRIVKAGRLLRIVGVLRMAHFMEVLTRIIDRHSLLSEKGYFVIEVLLLLMTILWLNHVIGCAWYFIGAMSPGDTDSGWLDMPVAGEGSMTYRHSGFWYQYTTSLHWAVSQMTPGSMQVSPVNSVERAFNIICLLSGMLIASTLVSSLSAKMMHMKMSMQEQNKRIWTLRRFLRSSLVSSHLAVSVQKQASERLRLNARPLTVKDVAVVSLLSHSLRTELLCELCRPHLHRHPFFRLFEHVDAGAMRRLCREAVEFIVLSRGDTLFHPGVQAGSAYVLSSGLLRYSQHPATSRVDVETVQKVRPGTWLCEAALWSAWTHVGGAEAAEVCQCMAVSSEGLAKALSSRGLIQEVAWGYAVSYHARVIDSAPPKAPWPNDLGVAFSDFTDVLLTMEWSVQVYVSLLSLRIARARSESAYMPSQLWSTGSTTEEKLEKEVRNRKCVLHVDDNDELQRVVAVTVLHVTSQQGAKMLVQLGKLEDGRLEAACALPGVKAKEGELSSESLRRLLWQRLSPFAGIVSPENVSVRQVIESKESKTLGVKTKYIRNIHECDLHEDQMHPDGVVFLDGGPVHLRTSSSMQASRIRALLEEGTLARVGRRNGQRRPSQPVAPLQLQVFPVPDVAGTSTVYLYAWVTEDDFKNLNAQAHNDHLRSFLASLALESVAPAVVSHVESGPPDIDREDGKASLTPRTVQARDLPSFAPA